MATARPFNSIGGFSVGEGIQTVVLANGDISTANGTFTSNVAAGNVKTDNLLYANGNPWNFLTAGGGSTQIQYNSGGSLAGSANFTYNPNVNLLTLTGNALLGNVSTTGTITSGGNVTAPNFIGNFIGNITGNLLISGTNGAIVYNDTGEAGTSPAFKFDEVANAVTLTGNITTQNASLGNLVTANYFSGDGRLLSNVDAVTAGTVTTNAQPNITSVGTLTSLSVTGTATTGNVSTGNLTVSGVVISSLIPASDSTYNLGNTTRYWQNAYISGTILFNNSGASISAIAGVIQIPDANIENGLTTGTFRSRGNANVEGNMIISGNLTVGGTTTYVNSNNISIKDPMISLGGSDNGGNATTYDGKDRGLWLRNYKSDASGPVNQFVGWDTSNGEFALGSNVSVLNDVVTFNEFGNIRGATAIFTNLSGNLTNANQPNITQVGTLSNLTVSGNLTVQGFSNLANLKAGGLQYPTVDGTAGQYLKTDGSGALSWGTVSTTSITNGLSNVSIPVTDGNVNIVVNDTYVANYTPTGANITGTANISGITSVGYLVVGNTSIRAVTTTTASTTPNQTLFTLSGSQFTAIEIIIKGVDPVGTKYSVASILAVHDASSIDYTTFGSVNIGGSCGSYDLTYSGGIMSLKVTPATSNTITWTIQYRLI